MNEPSPLINYTGYTHKLIFLWPVVFIFAGLALYYYLPGATYLCLFFMGFGVLAMFTNFLTYLSTYVQVSNHGVKFHTGIISRESVEIPLTKIESIDVRQNIIGSIFNYGTIIVTGTGGTKRYLGFVAAPLTCRRYIEQAISRR